MVHPSRNETFAARLRRELRELFRVAVDVRTFAALVADANSDWFDVVLARALFARVRLRAV